MILFVIYLTIFSYVYQLHLFIILFLSVYILDILNPIYLLLEICSFTLHCLKAY